jgi:hypothetical protein
VLNLGQAVNFEEEVDVQAGVIPASSRGLSMTI